MSDDGDLFGFALGLGESKPIERNHDSNVSLGTIVFQHMENLMM